jgi:hypothetical protein
MAGFTSQTATYLSLCLYVQIALLVLGGRYAQDGSTLAVALGLCAVHGAMLELLQTFVVLSAFLIAVDLYVFIKGGLVGWLIFLLCVNLVARVGSIWFGCVRVVLAVPSIALNVGRVVQLCACN